MQRDLAGLTESEHDLLVVGGGIYGACMAWEAASRGLSVALLEKNDFGYATSANSLKTIHGGLRYLQQADIKRMRESIRERKSLMRIAPHLVYPLPFIIPTYGHGLMGREAMALALLLNDLLSLDRNWGTDLAKKIPNGRTLSRRECLQLLPGIPEKDLTGAAVWYDAQVRNSERLSLAFIRSAAEQGAKVNNYVEAISFLQRNGRIFGVIARDGLTGEEFDIQAKMVLTAVGPWTDQLLDRLGGGRPFEKTRFAKAFNLITRQLFKDMAVGLPAKERFQDEDSILNKGMRLLFYAPWNGRTMIGTKYDEYAEDPSRVRVTDRDLELFLDETNKAYPCANLEPDDVKFFHIGLIPISGINSKTGSIQRAKNYQIRDHGSDGLSGLISVIGVKYTTARDVAEKTIDLISERLGAKIAPSKSAITPLFGGDIGDFNQFVQSAIDEKYYCLGAEELDRLIANYGSAYPDVLKYLKSERSGPPDRSALLKAQVLYSIREEMACKLTDVVFRRADLGTGGKPDDDLIYSCARWMAGELGWDKERVQAELDEVSQVYNLRIQK